MWEWGMVGVEFDISRFGSVESTVNTLRYVLAGMECGASLSDDDLAREDVLVCRGKRISCRSRLDTKY